MIDLSGKTALVCGASQGIGQATAIKMAAMGAKVIVLARTEEKLQALLPKLRGEGHDYIAIDLNDRKNLATKLEEKITQVNGIDILICNSGGPKAGPLAEASEEEFLAGFSNHILANALMVKAVIPSMKKSGYGRIINVISTSVKVPIANLGVSNTIRGAVASWAKTLSMELGAFGITVNNVLPGYTNTPRLEALIKAAATRQSTSEDDVIKQWKAKVPAARFAESEEVANAVTFLASPAASYVNGINLPVDGGRTGAL